MNLLKRISNNLRILIFCSKGIKISSSVKLEHNVHLKLTPLGTKYGSIKINENCELSRGTVIKTYGGDVRLQKNVFVGEYVIMYGHGGITIGDNTLIAMQTCIVSSNHTIPGIDELIRSKGDVLLPVNIGSDVWIGAGCKILGGITIGNGCVIGAGTIVNKDLPPYSISAGNPAKVIKYRS
jgi:acetyltransferase-like isoleucine patch superfamily enzyme